MTIDPALPRWRGTVGSTATLGAFGLLVAGLSQYLVFQNVVEAALVGLLAAVLLTGLAVYVQLRARRRCGVRNDLELRQAGYAISNLRVPSDPHVRSVAVCYLDYQLTQLRRFPYRWMLGPYAFLAVLSIVQAFADQRPAWLLATAAWIALLGAQVRTHQRLPRLETLLHDLRA